MLYKSVMIFNFDLFLIFFLNLSLNRLQNIQYRRNYFVLWLYNVSVLLSSM